jgi:hypothetical protein
MKPFIAPNVSVCDVLLDNNKNKASAHYKQHSANIMLATVAPETETEHGCKGLGLCVSVSADFALVRLLKY